MAYTEKHPPKDIGRASPIFKLRNKIGVLQKSYTYAVISALCLALQ